MSSKHYFPSAAANTLVVKNLKALVSSNPGLGFIEKDRVVYNTSHTSSKVSLISGGGSGHEPAWSGYVGDGLLSAAVCGDIFASPSAKQVLSGITRVPSNKGTILLVTNYTGDKLHFGLAAEEALAKGVCKNLAVLSCTDDVAIGKSTCGRVGRRGLAGNVLIMKTLGAASERDFSFEKCVEMGKAMNSQLVSIGSSLDHCHVPGRQGHNSMSDDDVYIGSGIHNEPGAQRISPFPSTEEIINRMLLLLLDPKDQERAFVPFGPKDEVVLLINNYGGLSTLELGALSQEILEQLESKWNINPVQRHIGTFETSLNGPGFSITLLNLSTTASLCTTTTSDLLSLLNAETAAPCWPNVKAHTQVKVSQNGNHKTETEEEFSVPENEDLRVDPALLDAVVRSACNRAIAAEPNLTKWDTIMGDGDCGEGVKEVCQAILTLLSPSDKTPSPTSTGSIPTLLHALLPTISNMGGTLGAIFGILLAAFASSLRAVISRSPSGERETGRILAEAFSQATKSLMTHTAARVGDRTVMDAIIPFSEAFLSYTSPSTSSQTSPSTNSSLSTQNGNATNGEIAKDEIKSFADVIQLTQTAASSTGNLKARFGRASYVGIEGDEARVPDAGAWAFGEIVGGIGDALSA